MRFNQHLFATLLRLNRGFSCETALLNRRIGRSFRIVAGSFVPICHMFYLRIDGGSLFLSACGSLFHPHLPFLFRDRHQPPSQSPQRPRDPVVRIAGGHFSCIQSWIFVMDLYTCWHGLSPFLHIMLDDYSRLEAWRILFEVKRMLLPVWFPKVLEPGSIFSDLTIGSNGAQPGDVVTVALGLRMGHVGILTPGAMRNQLDQWINESEPLDVF